VHHTFISFFSGRSEMIDLSVFRRRSTNGPVARFSAAVASASWRTSIGSWNRRRNRFAGPSIPGLQNSMIDHSSARWFSTGVPVRASRVRAGIARTAWACRVPLFLIACASSHATRPQSTSRSAPRSRSAVP
jgi:hypothetical protein